MQTQASTVSESMITAKWLPPEPACASSAPKLTRRSAAPWLTAARRSALASCGTLAICSSSISPTKPLRSGWPGAARSPPSTAAPVIAGVGRGSVATSTPSTCRRSSVPPVMVSRFQPSAASAAVACALVSAPPASLADT